MKKLFFWAFLLASLVSCSSGSGDYETRKSAIRQIGAVGKRRVLFLENGDILRSRSDVAFGAIPGDTAEYSRKGDGDWTITILFNKERQSLPPKRKETDSGSDIIFYPLPLAR